MATQARPYLHTARERRGHATHPLLSSTMRSDTATTRMAASVAYLSALRSKDATVSAGPSQHILVVYTSSSERKVASFRSGRQDQRPSGGARSPSWPWTSN
uniref:Uncharacterized protein n=1 Tax=Zea mays TaxID=4577 RepID=A0A804QWC9_MAIZE